MDEERLHVAVVDDEESVRVGLGRVLRWAGMEVEIYGSGEELLASRLEPDCVVLDLHMPGMSGFDTRERLASMEKLIPVVIITGHDSPENRERATSVGASDYLLKPVDGGILIDAIKTAVLNRSIPSQT